MTWGQVLRLRGSRWFLFAHENRIAEPLAALLGHVGHGAGGLEHQQLLARRLVVPFAVALDNVQQLVGRPCA